MNIISSFIPPSHSGNACSVIGIGDKKFVINETTESIHNLITSLLHVVRTETELECLNKNPVNDFLWINPLKKQRSTNKLFNLYIEVWLHFMTVGPKAEYTLRRSDILDLDLTTVIKFFKEQHFEVIGNELSEVLWIINKY